MTKCVSPVSLFSAGYSVWWGHWLMGKPIGAIGLHFGTSGYAHTLNCALLVELDASLSDDEKVTFLNWAAIIEMIRLRQNTQVPDCIPFTIYVNDEQIHLDINHYFATSQNPNKHTSWRYRQRAEIDDLRWRYLQGANNLEEPVVVYDHAQVLDLRPQYQAAYNLAAVEVALDGVQAQAARLMITVDL